LVLILYIYISVSTEVTKSTYETYEEIASIPNIFEAGWIPRWLPKTARNIKESHNIDTNEAWIVFSFSPVDKFYEACRIIIENKVILPTEKQIRHFPNFVVKGVSELKGETVTFYQCNDDSSRNLAVDHGSAYAYIWGNLNPLELK